MVHTILIIEDDEHLAGAMKLIFKHSGYEVILCDTGLLGSQTAITDRPNFIICDYNLPDINGIEVTLSMGLKSKAVLGKS